MNRYIEEKEKYYAKIQLDEQKKEDLLETKLVTVKDYADYCVDKLLASGYIVHRYSAVTTNSEYLKVDYGVAGSIRISDHVGKSHLHYRFNLQCERNDARVQLEHTNVCIRYYFGALAVDMLLKKVSDFREQRIRQYGSMPEYLEHMDRLRAYAEKKTGFWLGAQQCNGRKIGR